MKNIIILIIIALTISACEKIVDIKIDEKEKQIVANGILTPDSLIKIQVSKSLSILEDEKYLQYLNSAEVKLYADGVFVENMAPSKDGIFISSDTTDIAKTYSFDISYDKLQSIHAETKIPDLVEIASIDTAVIQDGSDGYMQTFIDLTVNFSDPANVQNYYLIGVSYYEPIYDDQYINIIDSIEYFTWISSDDDIFGSDYNYFSLNGIEGQVINDEMFNGNDYSLRVKLYPSYYSDKAATYNVYFLSITKDLYLHISSYNKAQGVGDNPFTQPVQVYSNIENGLGIFSAYNLSKTSFRMSIDFSNDWK